MSLDHTGWEYTSFDARNSVSINRLNDLGAEGWELVTVDRYLAILKRPIPDLREIVTTDQRTRVYAEHDAGTSS